MNLSSTKSKLWLVACVCVFSATAARADWLSIAAVLKKCPPPAATAPAMRDIVIAHPAFKTPKPAKGHNDAKQPGYAFPSVVTNLQPKNAATPSKTNTTQGAPQKSHGNRTVTEKAGQQPPAQQPPAQTQIKPVVPTPVQTPAQTPPPIVTQPQTSANGEKLVSNVFAGTDIREALSEIASSAGVTIIPDDTIKTTLVYMEFKNEPIGSAIEKLALLSGAYVKEQAPGVYLVSQATPDAGLFRMFAENETFFTQNTAASAIQTMLPTTYKPYVQFDVKSNRISVTAPGELMPKILADIHNMDKPPRQFVVEALVTEMDDTGSLNTGFSWNWKNFSVGTDLSLNYTQASQQDVATLMALIGAGKASLRANPRVTAFEGQESTLTIGQDTYFSILTGNVTFPTAQIQLIKTGVTLDFTGYIGDDGTITLNLAPEVSDAVVAVNGNPTTNVRRVSTMVRMRPGETIAIGGLVQEITSYSSTKVPVLGYIPLIGELFTQRTNTTSKKDVVILITPHFTDEGTGTTGQDSARPAPKATKLIP